MDLASERLAGEVEAGLVFADDYAYDDSRNAGERQVVSPCFAEHRRTAHSQWHPDGEN